MKIMAVILFCILANTFQYAQNYWERVTSPTTRLFYDSFLLDTVYGWASGDSGMIVHTSNGGESWVLQNSGIDFYPVEKLFFIDRNNGWALVNDFLFFGTIILRTSNGGANWSSSRFYDTTQVINAVHFLNHSTGYISGFTGKIFKTTNSGVNWSECRIDTNYCPFLFMFPKAKFYFTNSQTGFVCGGQRDIQGIIWKTTDSGANWFTYCLTAEPLLDVKAFSNGWVVTAGGDPEYGLGTAQSTDNGVSWSSFSVGNTGIGYNLAYRTPSEVWIPMGFGKTFVVSLDSGNANSDWIVIPATDSISVYSAGFASETCGWAFGDKGEILKYNKNIIGISNSQNNIPERNYLRQNYPNPFNPSTVISYDLSKPADVKITIYDLLGREAAVIFQGWQTAGNHKTVFLSKNLASGIYIYKITVGDFSDTKKMVILK